MSVDVERSRLTWWGRLAHRLPADLAPRHGAFGALLRLPALALAVPVAVVLAAVGAAAVLAGTPTYQSSATLAIDQTRALVLGDSGVIEKLSRLRYKYAGLVGTDRIAGPVAQRTGVSPTAVSGALYATVDPTSLLMTVGAHTSDPARARTLATAAANEMVAYVAQEQAAAQIPAASRFTFAVVVPARGAQQIAPTTKRAAAVTGALGLVGLAGTLGAVEIARRRS